MDDVVFRSSSWSTYIAGAIVIGLFAGRAMPLALKRILERWNHQRTFRQLGGKEDGQKGRFRCVSEVNVGIGPAVYGEYYVSPQAPNLCKDLIAKSQPDRALVIPVIVALWLVGFGRNQGVRLQISGKEVDSFYRRILITGARKKAPCSRQSRRGVNR